MSENRFFKQITLTQEQLVQFCPLLPKKDVIITETEQRIMSSELGYNYVSQLYLRKIAGETSSGIWKLKDDGCEVIQMNSSPNKYCCLQYLLNKNVVCF